MMKHSSFAATSGSALTDDPRDDKIRELEWQNRELRDEIKSLGVDLNNTRIALQNTQAAKTKVGAASRGGGLMPRS